jgi:hypothetical protein
LFKIIFLSLASSRNNIYYIIISSGEFNDEVHAFLDAPFQVHAFLDVPFQVLAFLVLHDVDDPFVDSFLVPYDVDVPFVVDVAFLVVHKVRAF